MLNNADKKDVGRSDHHLFLAPFSETHSSSEFKSNKGKKSNLTLL